MDADASKTVLEQALIPLSTAILSGVSAWVSTHKRILTQFKRQEERLHALDQRLSGFGEAIEGLDRRITGVKAAAIREADGAVKKATEESEERTRIEVRQIREGVERNDREMRGYMTRFAEESEMAAHMREQAKQWSELNRVLGQVQGQLHMLIEAAKNSR